VGFYQLEGWGMLLNKQINECISKAIYKIINLKILKEARK